MLVHKVEGIRMMVSRVESSGKMTEVRFIIFVHLFQMNHLHPALITCQPAKMEVHHFLRHVVVNDIPANVLPEHLKNILGHEV